MPVIHPNTLFHFTKKLTDLQSILQNGLRLSYCFEEFRGGNGIALPMVCFCDIPLLRTPQHRERYGNYMIGLTKDFFRKDTDFLLNPVMYRYSTLVKHIGVDFLNKQMDIILELHTNEIKQYIKDNDVRFDESNLQEQFSKNNFINSKIKQITEEKTYLLYSYAFSKLYATEKAGEAINNYDECEWRYVYPYLEDKDNNMWKLDIDKSKFKEDKTKLNKELWEKDHSRIIPDKDICKCISFIVVETNEEIEPMIKFIRDTNTIFGHSITQEEKDIIISKITSFDSIEKNY